MIDTTMPLCSILTYLEKIIVSSGWSVNTMNELKITTYRRQICNVGKMSSNILTSDSRLPHTQDCSVSGCNSSAEVPRDRTFGQLLQSIDVTRHGLLEDRPHLQPDPEYECLQRTTVAFLHLRHYIFCQANHGQKRYHRRRRIKQGLHKGLKTYRLKYQSNSVLALELPDSTAAQGP